MVDICGRAISQGSFSAASWGLSSCWLPTLGLVKGIMPQDPKSTNQETPYADEFNKEPLSYPKARCLIHNSRYRSSLVFLSKKSLPCFGVKDHRGFKETRGPPKRVPAVFFPEAKANTHGVSGSEPLELIP